MRRFGPFLAILLVCAGCGRDIDSLEELGTAVGCPGVDLSEDGDSASCQVDGDWVFLVKPGGSFAIDVVGVPGSPPDLPLYVYASDEDGWRVAGTDRELIIQLAEKFDAHLTN